MGKAFMVIALVMAGGKGTRMKSDLEKPLIMMGDKPLVQYVIEALQDSEEVERIVVATSPQTHQTTLFSERLGIDTLETPGEGYLEDLGFLLSKEDFKDEVLLTITCDLPLITGEMVDQVVGEYRKSSKPAMSVMVPLEIFQEHGLQPTMVLGNLVPSGLNILRGKDKEQDEEVLVLGKIELALNINSPEDIISLERLENSIR
jgi:adenosylcobinamide-phosphate guanylyltransferase